PLRHGKPVPGADPNVTLAPDARRLPRTQSQRADLREGKVWGQMMRHLRSLCALLTAAGLGIGCFGSKPTRFYMLSTVAPAAGTSVASSGDSRVIAVGPVSIPDYVDRPQIVLRENANQVQISSFDNWAG